VSQPEATKRVAVFCKPHSNARAVLEQIAGVLRRRRIELSWDEDAARILDLPAGVPRGEAARCADLVVSVGGDGTLLATARAVGAAEKPILGVNLGSLGFLTETRREEVVESLEAAIDRRAIVERRGVLEVSRDGDPATPGNIALNDVVFSKKDTARLFALSLLVDGEWVADYRADGLIVATPTGSTAYNLSAGGPLVVPGAEVLLATPICPHSLSQRPLILAGGAKVAVRLAEERVSSNVHVTLDGQVGFPLQPGETVNIRRGPHAVLLVRPPGKTYFSTLRDKLGWGHP
jgi:NAD+ kinase